MASSIQGSDAADFGDRVSVAAAPTVGAIFRMILAPFASLYLTIVLFALSIFLVLAGTLAQQYLDIWSVVDGYFRAPIAWIDFHVFSFFFGGRWPKEGWTFPFPGGLTIGVALAVNLAAAHSVRFKVQARSGRLLAGLIALVLGTVVTALVVATGSSEQISESGAMQASGDAATQWTLLWLAIKIGVFLALLASIAGAVLLFVTRAQHHRRAEMWLCVAAAVIIAPLLLWMLVRGHDYLLGDSSMRILWQLIKGEIAALALLAGCILLFKRRAGIVLIHAGVALVMINEFVVYTMHTEAVIPLFEGEAANYVRDIRTFELAVIDASDEKEDRVVVVPESRVLGDDVISDEKLPFDVKVVKFFTNSHVRRLAPGETSRADAGIGTAWIAEPMRGSTGTDMDSGVDRASAYIELLRKRPAEDSDGQEGDVLGTYLVTLALGPNVVVVDGKTYQVDLRHKRIYKSYSIALVDVRADTYTGTTTTRNFSSDIRIVDPMRSVDRKAHIWMNNPLRFAGETFYQQGYNSIDGREMTTLQVVTNTGWLIPYVACMIVGTGMLAQFLVVLLRFLNRRAVEEEEVVEAVIISDNTWLPIVSRWFPAAVVAVFALYFAGKALPARTPKESMQIHEFGKLPLKYEGRVKPFDTVARNSMMIISGRQYYEDKKDKKQPAIRWLLDVTTNSEQAEKHKIFRIENLEVLDLLGLERRSGFRYAYEEFDENVPELGRQSLLVGKKDAAKRDAFDRKLIETAGRVRLYHLLRESLTLPGLNPRPDEEVKAINFSRIARRDLRGSTIPRAMPPELKKAGWESATMAGTRNWLKHRAAKHEKFTVAELAVTVVLNYQEWLEDDPQRKPLTAEESQRLFRDLSLSIEQALVITDTADEVVGSANLDDEVDPVALSLLTVYSAYADEDEAAFNEELVHYRELLEGDPEFAEMMPRTALGKAFSPVTDFEAYFNHVEPFFYSAVFYLVAFGLAVLAWLGWSKPLNGAAFWLIVFSLVIHTLALSSRVYISGRPPVTNLYSSAVFIAWGAVVLGLAFERIFRMGVGNVIAGVAGFAGLLIGHFLSADGDTLKVLQAVLDTQFWLATHVVCVTLGYATTLVAGLLGIVYIVRGLLTASLSKGVDRDITRMIYGTLCFALLFSFIGTVLGGLWADDSWGRFWGWDPKENGALIIVLWNALVLHARWGGIVRNRGLAVLAVAGIITTGWSWFGVNELGVGLHSYGFTEGVLFWLFLFGVLTPGIFIAAGMLPKHLWVSFVEQQRIKDAVAFQRTKRQQKS